MTRKAIPLRTWCTLATAAACVLLVVLVNERRKRLALEDGLRSAVALTTALAESDREQDAAVRDRVGNIGYSARRGRMLDASEEARKTLVQAFPEWRASGDARLSRKATAFLLKHDELRQRLLHLVSGGRSMARDGRDTARLREGIGLALNAAADADATRVADALDAAKKARDGLPFRSRLAAAGARGTAGEQARSVLLECRHPSRVCEELMTEGHQSVAKIVLASRSLLAAGEEEPALWAAETAAYLLGLRSAPRPGGGTAAGEAVRPTDLPEADEGQVRRFIDTAKPLVSGKKASGVDVFPADQLLLEAERRLGQGQVRLASLLAAAGLNVMGMSDQALAGLAAGEQ